MTPKKGTVMVMPENGTTSTTNFFVPTTSTGFSIGNGSQGNFVVTVAPVEEDAPAKEERGAGWEGPLAIEGSPTSDRRYLMPGEIGERDLPLPVAASHDDQDATETVGRIDSIQHIPVAEFDKEGWDDLVEKLKDAPPQAVVIWGEGTFDGSPESDDALRQLENGVGVSLDLPMERQAIIDAETYEEVDPSTLDEEDLLGLMFGKTPEGYLRGIGGKIGGLSLASIAAFEETTMRINDDHALVASAYGIKLRSTVLTAAAAGAAPLKPPFEWFFEQEPDHPVPLTITSEGRVFGHLALWNQCHSAFASCERAPASKSDYSYFHVGEIECSDGAGVTVGRITVGGEGNAKGGHASVVLGRQGAMEHYDKTGCVGAFVRASNGKQGIWLSGAVRSDAPAERIRDMRANPPSGDWRDDELVAVLSVPVPGFAIPRVEALIASAENGNEEVRALIATGYTGEEYEALDMPTYRQRMQGLSERRKRTSTPLPGVPAEKAAMIMQRLAQGRKVTKKS